MPAIQTKSLETAVNDGVITLDAPATDGHVLILVVWISSDQTLTISDDGGTMTWNQVLMATHPTAAMKLAIYWGTVSGSPQVVTMASSGTALTCGHLLEWSGLHATPADGSDDGEATTTTSHDVASGVTPSQADVLLVGGVVSSNAAVFSLPGDFTAIGAISNRAHAGYRVVDSIAAYFFPTTSANNETSISVLAAFKLGSGGLARRPRLVTVGRGSSGLGSGRPRLVTVR